MTPLMTLGAKQVHRFLLTLDCLDMLLPQRLAKLHQLRNHPYATRGMIQTRMRMRTMCLLTTRSYGKRREPLVVCVHYLDIHNIFSCRNTRAPMPDVVLTSNSSNAPPPAALAGPMKILKRPTAATSPASSGLSNSSDASSLAQREARYKMARDRIFGSPNSSIPGTPSEGSQSDLASTNPPGRNSNNSTNIARNPRGPSSSGDTDVKSVSKGFINRQKK